MQTQHIIIPVSLSQHACCGDGEVGRVAVDYRIRRNLQQLPFRYVGFPFVAIDEYVLRPYGQSVQGALHAEDGTLQDIAFVYLLRRHFDNCPTDRLAFDDRPERVALFLRQLLGVVEPFELRDFSHPLGIQDHCGAEHASCQRTSARFVTPGFHQSCYHLSLQHCLIIIGIHRYT